MKMHPIIFVDDNVKYLQLVENIVEQAGIKAHYATSGDEALGILRMNRCEIMITDLNMPGMDGYTLSMLAKELFPEIHIILVTGAASSDVSRLAAKAGIARVIAKPVRAEQVREIVKGATPASLVAW
jgi:DNA-binding NtrC family response regulator